MTIRKATSADSAVLGGLAARMWEHDPAELAAEFAVLTESAEAACFLAFDGKTAIGFAQCQLRHDYVEGCETSPVGFLEGIFVAEGYRLTGLRGLGAKRWLHRIRQRLRAGQHRQPRLAHEERLHRDGTHHLVRQAPVRRDPDGTRIPDRTDQHVYAPPR